MGLGYYDRDSFLRDRGVHPRDDGSWWEDSYDFGLYWYDSDRRSYRLTWIGPIGRDSSASAPGELYIEELRHGAVTFLCTIPPDPTGADVSHNVQQILDGWAEVCGEPNSIHWIFDRVREALEAGWAQPPTTKGPT